MEIVLQNYHTSSILIQFLTRHSSTVDSVGLDPSRTNFATMKQERPVLQGKPSGKPVNICGTVSARELGMGHSGPA